MRHNLKTILPYLPWLLLLLGIDAFAALLLWIADVQAFRTLTGVILLASLLLFCILCCILIRLEQKRETAFLDFICNPDAYHEELLFKNMAPTQRTSLAWLSKILRDHQDTSAGLKMQLSEYEEYVESWAHETKTPLSLLTLLLDNHGDELSAAVSLKLDYIRNRMQESVDHMLFYARLKGSRKDYLFESLPVRACIEEVLEDYRPLLEEKQFRNLFCASRPMKRIISMCCVSRITEQACEAVTCPIFLKRALQAVPVTAGNRPPEWDYILPGKWQNNCI